MIKDIAWHFFKKTGNILTFLEYKNLHENKQDIYILENDANNKKMGDIFGNSKDKGNSNRSSKF